jgi:hypothetical protein
VSQLIFPLAIEPSRTLGGFARRSHVRDRNPVAIALLMAERHRFCDDDDDDDDDNDNDNDNDCVRCSTCC